MEIVPLFNHQEKKADEEIIYKWKKKQLFYFRFLCMYILMFFIIIFEQCDYFL